MRRRSLTRAAILALLPMLAGAGGAGPDDGLSNAFGDPFFRIADAIADCPLPAGPYIDEAERRVQAHHRAERGTTCWLAGRCERPNAYAYDADIAAALQAALRRHNPFADTSVWVTVQGRVVYLEGCVARPAQAAELETFARAVPNVQQAIAIVRDVASAPPPYRTRGR
jgi:hypothetical protein